MAKYTPKTTEELKALVADESIYLGDIDTSAITDMSSLFLNSERKDFSGIELWDTSNVLDMTAMFSLARNFNSNISSWDTSSVVYMSFMFALAKCFNQNINSWDISNVVAMPGMFSFAENFNQPLDKWDTSNVVDMYSMFEGATNFNQNLNAWDTSSVRNNSKMFLNSGIKSLPKWWKNKEMTKDESGNFYKEISKKVEQAKANPRSKEQKQIKQNAVSGYTKISQTNESKFKEGKMGVPSDKDYSTCAFLSYIVTFVVAAFGGAIGATHKGEWWEISYAIILGVASPFIGYIAYLILSYLTKCPKCGERFCIEYTDVRTVAESIVTERKNGKIKKYRVGVEHIEWQCTNCGYKNEGDVEYKKEV